MSLSLSGKVFVVTGGAGAIARSILEALVAAGAKVVVADRSAPHAAAVAAAVGGVPLAIDLGSIDGATRMLDAASAIAGPLHGLVHTVGAFTGGPLERAEAGDFDRAFDANVRTLFHVVRAFAPRLRARGEGFLAAIGSEPAVTGRAPGSALYGASKSAAATLLRSLDDELAGTDVAVTVCHPMGMVDTAANRKNAPDVDPETMIDPADIAAALVLCATRGPRGRIPEIAVYPRRAH